MTGREPDDGQRGTGAGEVPAGYSVVGSVPLPGFSRCGAVPLAALIPSPCPGCWPGGMGRVRVREGRSGGLRVEILIETDLPMTEIQRWSSPISSLHAGPGELAP